MSSCLVYENEGAKSCLVLQSVHYNIYENLSKIAYFYHEYLPRAFALMLARVIVANTEIEAVGSSEFLELSFLGLLVVAGPRKGGGVCLNGCWWSRRWPAHVNNVVAQCLCF